MGGGFYNACGAGERQPPAVFFPEPHLFRLGGVTEGCNGDTDFLRGDRLRQWFTPGLSDYGAPIDSLRLIFRGLNCSGFTPFTPTLVGVPAAEYRSGLLRSNPARSVRSTFAGCRLPTTVMTRSSQRVLKTRGL